MINIMLCGNRGIFDGVLTCALSIFMRTETKEPFAFYLLSMDVSHLREDYLPITEEQRAFLEGVAKSYNPESRVYLTDVSGLYAEEFAGCPNESAYCSPYTLIRLLADRIDILPDKLLYLDADIMFNRDITLLYGTDVSGVEYAAARDHYGKYLIYPNFVNAGVILFNMEYAVKTGLFKKAREELRKKKLTFADESALIRATTKKKMLKQRFNDQKYLHKHTVVRHFSKRLFWLPYPHTENIKQWQVDRVRKVFGYKQFDDVYEEYFRLSELLKEGR